MASSLPVGMGLNNNAGATARRPSQLGPTEPLQATMLLGGKRIRATSKTSNDGSRSSGGRRPSLSIRLPDGSSPSRPRGRSGNQPSSVRSGTHDPTGPSVIGAVAHSRTSARGTAMTGRLGGGSRVDVVGLANELAPTADETRRGSDFSGREQGAISPFSSSLNAGGPAMGRMLEHSSRHSPAMLPVDAAVASRTELPGALRGGLSGYAHGKRDSPFSSDGRSNRSAATASSGDPEPGYATNGSCCATACNPCLRLAGRLSGVDDMDAIAHEADTWWALAWPLGVTAAARLSLVVVDQAFVGHLGTAELAGASLAGVWIDVVSGWLWPSFGAAVNTLSAQAIGAKNPALAGVWLQTGLFLSTLAAIPVAIALLLSEPVYLAFGFGVEESRLAGKFSSWIATGILPAFWYLVVSSFLKAQSDVMAAMVICLAMVVLNALLNILFIHGTSWFQPAGADPLWAGLGFEGSPLATATSRWLSLVALVTYAWMRRAHQAKEEQQTRVDTAHASIATPSRFEGAALPALPRAAPKNDECLDDTASNNSYTAPAAIRARGGGGCCGARKTALTKGSASVALLKGGSASPPTPGTAAATAVVSPPGRATRQLRLTSTFAGIDCREALSGKRLWQLGIAFALPLALSNMLEELQLQVVAFMAAELGQAELAAHTCMLTLFFFCSSAMYSAVQATSTRVAHHLGAGNIPKAKLAMWIDVQFSVVAAISVATVLGVAGENLARIFSNDPAVLNAVRPLSVLVGCAYAFICIFFCSMAVLNAMGKTSAVAIAFVTGAWMVAIPSAFVFDRVLHLGLNGLWYGLVAGYTVVSFIALWFLVRADWEEASRKAVKRAARRQVASHSSQFSRSSRKPGSQLALANRSPPRGPASPLHVVHETEHHPVPGLVGGGSALSINDQSV